MQDAAESGLALVPHIKAQLDRAREELKNQTPNREIVAAHIDTAEAMLDAWLEVLPIEVPDRLRG